MARNKEKDKAPAYLNPELPLDIRVNDLIGRLTIEEKIRLIPTQQSAIERLGVEEYSVGGEAAHGWVSREGDPATVFPQPIGLACTWDTELMYQVGSVIGDEVRAYYKKKKGGLTLWAPTVDMERDPRWGRTEEAYGEDPFLTGKLTTALVKGMQGDHPFYLKMAATLKHFFANNNEEDRCECSVSIDPRNMKEYYWKAFEPAVVEGDVCCIMTAYNSVNGTPCILNKDVKEIIKKEWGLRGFVVADGGDFSQTVTRHRYYSNHAESIAGTLKSGIDCIPDDPELIIKALKEALARELLTEDDIDQALRNIFRIRFRLGQFDPEELNPYTEIGDDIICHPRHSRLALEAAHKSIVLLKNKDKLLPINRDKVNRVAVIGPLGDDLYQGWYTGTFPYKITPLQGIKEKLKGKEVTYHKGCNDIALCSMVNNNYIGPDYEADYQLVADRKQLTEREMFELTDWGWGRYTLKSRANGKYLTVDNGHIQASADRVYGWYVKEIFGLIPRGDGNFSIKTWDDKNVELSRKDNRLLADSSCTGEGQFRMEIVRDGIKEAVQAAREADLAILFLGNHPLINGKEEIDRPDITLVPAQERLLREVYEVNPNTVLVIIGSYPIAVNWAEENIPAIVYSAHGGQEMGKAIADVLFGDYNPGGRLNMTWYSSIEQLPDIKDYDIIKGKRTYMYFEGEPLYPFGHGLSYTSFKYGSLGISSAAITADEEVKVKLKVKNTGPIGGDEVVQLYVRAVNSRVKRPRKELKGFQRLYLEPGETTAVSFTIKARELDFWDVTREKYCVETGDYQIMVGSSSTDIRLTGMFKVMGEAIPPRNLTVETRAINYDDYRGVILDEGPEKNTCVRFSNKESWISFHEVDFKEGINTFEIQAISEYRDSNLEIRVGHPEGEVIGLCLIDKTEKWVNCKCKIDLIEGIQDIYIKGNRGIGINTFRFYYS